MFSTVSFSCCSWLWANKCIDVSTVWPCRHTEGPHRGTFYVCEWFTVRHEHEHHVCMCVCSKFLEKQKMLNFSLCKAAYGAWTHTETDTHIHIYTHLRGDRVHWLSSDEPMATWGRRNVYGASPRETVRILSRQPRLSLWTQMWVCGSVSICTIGW